MSKHRLSKNRRPGKLQCKSTPHRLSIAQIQRRQWAGQMGGIGVAAAVIAVPLVFGGVAVVAGIPLDLSSPPSSPTGQRPLGPAWLPGVGAGLHTSGPAFNPLFRGNILDGSVASSPEVLHTALSLTLPSSNQPVGFWVGGRWVSADPIVRPTEPCPSPVLDPAGWLAWWHRYFPGVTPPALPSASPPVATAPPVSAPPVVAPAAPVEAESPPPATSLPAQSPPVVEAPAPVVDTSPVTVDVPAVDPPPVDLPPITVPVVDVPVDVPPIDLPPVDLPPVSVPPVDVSPVTDPITDALPEPVGDVVDGVTSVLSAPADVPSQDATTGGAENAVPLAAAVDSVAAPVDGSESARAGAEQHPTLLGTRTDHSTSGNVPGSLNGGDSRARDGGSSYVGRHRVDGQRQDRLPRQAHHDSGRPGGARAVSGVGHRAEGSSGDGGHNAGGKHRRSDGGHGSDRVKSHSKFESHSKSGGKSHSDSKSHDGGSKSHSSSGGSHGGGHRG